MNKTQEGDLEGPELAEILERKAAIRQAIRERRYILGEGTYAKLSSQISRKVLDLPEFTAAHRICSYVHKDSTREVRTTAILQAVLDTPDKELVVPISRTDRIDLDLSIVRDLADLQPATFNVPEPASQDLVEPESLDLVIMPCLAVDSTGNRLGYGKGYFDVLLARIRPEVPAMALAFELQLVPSIPPTPRDRKATIIVTEKRVIRCEP
jgi:5-formyltetrahydrofolate cyclo-ligase